MRKGKLQQSVLVRSVFKMLGQKREDAAGPAVGRGVSAFAGEKETQVFSCAPVLVKDPEDAVLAVCRVCNSVAAAGASAKGVLVSLMLPEAMEEKDLKELMRAVDGACVRYGTAVIGGHTEVTDGVLLCINGTGILNSWVKRNVAPEGISYSDMNRLAAQAPVGSAGVSILPFGNGAERMLENKETGCSICGVNFNLHGKQHIVRAAQEGIVFSFKYGIDIMEQMGIPVQKIHAGHANMFLSPIFRETLAGVTGAVIELYDTDGSVGAAKGAGIGAGVYKDNNEAFATLEKLEVIEPDVAQRTAYDDAYARWKSNLERAMAAF